MKTSKKLLSFFLAVVMLVSTCSVGFTAFAAEKNPTLWNDSTKADETYAALNTMADTYLAPLLGGLLGNDNPDATMQDVVAGLASMLMGVLGASGDGNPEKIIGTVDRYANVLSYMWYDDILNDPKNPNADFYSLYQFCLDYKDVSTSGGSSVSNEMNKELKKFANETLDGDGTNPGLTAILNQFIEKYDADSDIREAGVESFWEFDDKIRWVLDLDDVINTCTSPEEVAAIDIEGYLLDDYVAEHPDEFEGIDTYFNLFNSIMAEVNNPLRINKMSEMIFHMGDGEDNTFTYAIYEYLLSLAKIDMDLTGIDIYDKGELFSALCTGFFVYVYSDEGMAKVNNSKFSEADLKTGDPDSFLSKTMDPALSNITDFKNYVKSDECKLSSALKKYLDGISVDQHNALRFDTEVNGWTRASVVADAELNVPINMYREEFASTGLAGSTSDSINFCYLFQDIMTNKIVSKAVVANENRFKFDSKKYEIPENLSVAIVNTIINGYLDEYLAPGQKIAGLIDLNDIFDLFLDTKVDIYSTLKDIIINLYTDPIGTIFKLLPLLVVLIDELIIPFLLNGEGDSNYANGYGLLYEFLFDKDAAISLGGLLGNLIKEGMHLGDLTQNEGNTDIGIGAARFDLNILLPDLLHWLLADKDYTFTYYDVTPKNGDTPAVFNPVTTGKYNLNKTPVITNIYYVDKEIFQFAKISDIEGVAGEAVTELAAFFTDAIDSVVAEYGGVAKSVTSDGNISTKGLNNIFVAIPLILDRAGKNFNEKYGVKSDWSYSDHKVKINSVTGGSTTADVITNDSLTEFKNHAKGSNAENILDTFVGIFINDWVNSLLDFLNGALSTENKITKEIPMITGLLNALGGLGENSVLSDVLNGVFQLQNTDKASFKLAVYNEKTGYVGLNTTSAYFLLSNIGQLVGVIENIIDNTKNDRINKVEATYSSTPKPGENKYPTVWGDVPKTAKKGTTFVTKLDYLLAGVLENSTINNFNMNSNAGIASGIISLFSFFIGSDNEKNEIKLLNSYLYQLNEQDKKGTNTSDANIYNEKNLTNLVVQTYTLLENIIELFLTEQDALGINVFYDNDKVIYGNSKDGKYVYNILTAALEGLISPQAVSKYVDNSAAAKKLASLTCWHDAVKTTANNNGKTGVTNISINWGFKAGDTTGFFKSMGEGLGVITELLGIIVVDTGYYDNVLYPLLKDLDTAQINDLGVYAKGTVNDGVTALLSIIKPVGNLLNNLYTAPVSAIINLVKGLSIFINKNLNNAAHAIVAPLYGEAYGICNILSADISNLIPSLGNDIAWFDSLMTTILKLIIYTEVVKKDANGNPILDENGKPVTEKIHTPEDLAKIAKVIVILKGDFNLTDKYIVDLLNGLIGGVVTIPATFFKDIANCKNADAVLDYLLEFIAHLITNDGLIMKLLKNLIGDDLEMKQLIDMLGKLTAEDLMNIIREILSKTTDPTEVYWSFLQYVQLKTTGFYYPKGIRASDAEDAIGKLDDMVTSVFGLLSGLGVVDQANLKDLVTDLLFTNKNLTSLAKALYGAIEPYGEYLEYAGIDVSTKGVAKILTDKSYGKTYSTAAKSIKNAKNWNKVDKVNWGFKDGSAKAEQGFVNGLAAILRPFNDILAILLAGDSIAVGAILKNVADNLLGDLEVGSEKDTVQLKKGILYIRVKGEDKYSKTSTIKIDLNTAINGVLNEIKGLKIYGGNGYESAVIPLLEAIKCDGVRTYKQYKSDIKKAKDNLLLDILNPLFGFVSKLLDAPFDTLSAVLPNVAHFINGNGIAQLVNNLLSPITTLLPAFKKNGLDVNVIIEALLGCSLNELVTDALGVNIHLDLNNLNKCDIQNAIIPILNNLALKDLGIKLPNIKWRNLASRGTLKTVKSAARNSEGKFKTQQVTAKQGEVLIVVLRYIGNTLIDNTGAIKKLLKGIDGISKDVMKIINVVLNQLRSASADQIIRAIFYLLNEEPTNAFWNYSDYQTKEYEFSYPENMDVEFLKTLSPMLDGLIGGLLPLNDTVSDALFKDDLITSMITGIGKGIDGVKINDDLTLNQLLAMTGIDYTTKNVAKLLNDKSYGQTYASNASIIGAKSSWSKVDASSLKWGVTDRESFFNALCAALRPFYGVLDVLLNDASLGLFNIVYLPGSNGYTSTIVPLLEAFGGYNIKTQYQYRQDINYAYDNLLLDILNPLWDKVEDILNAPLQTLASMLPNLGLFIGNNGIIQLLQNLLVPISALLDAIKPIVDINDVLNAVLKMLKVDLNKTLASVGLKIKIDLYNLDKMLMPLIGAENIVPLLNNVLGIIKVGGSPLGLELPAIDWFALASHGNVIEEASQAATYGMRIHVDGDPSETLVAVLRFLVNTVNYKDNYTQISNLVGGLLGDNESVSDIVGEVLGILQGDTDEVISALCELLQAIA